MPGQPQSAHSDFVGSRLYVCIGVTCHLLFGIMTVVLFFITCHCGNTGVEGTPNKSQHTKLTLEKKILPLLLPGFKLATFRSQVWLSYQSKSGKMNTVNQYFCMTLWLRMLHNHTRFEKSETELTASTLKKDPKHTRD